TAAAAPCRALAARRLGRRLAQRQVDRKAGALAQFAAYEAGALIAGHDAMYDRQAEPGSLTGRLGRVEGIEDLSHRFFVHAAAAVGDLDAGIAPAGGEPSRVGGRFRFGVVEARECELVPLGIGAG